MKTVKPMLLLTAMTSLFFSCKKDSNTPSNDLTKSIQGSYDFLSLKSNTLATNVTISNGTIDSTINSIDAQSSATSGTVTIAATLLHVSKFTSVITSIIYDANYLNGILKQENEKSSQQTIPSVSNATTYKLIGNDSIYFEEGLISSPIIGIEGISGANISWAGDTLVINSVSTKTDTTVIATGIIKYSNRQASQVIKLKKK
jgi:hypothetical protein